MHPQVQIFPSDKPTGEERPTFEEGVAGHDLVAGEHEMRTDPSIAEPPLAVYRLSPRETQVAILTAEGLSAEDLAASLGIRVGTLRNIRRSLRHKLDVPTEVPLNETLFQVFGSGAPTEEPEEPIAPPSGVERRVHLSVRQAISSVGDLAERLDARAAAVSGAADRSRKSRDRLSWEAEQIQEIAAELHAVEQNAIARVRAHLAAVAG